MDYQDKIQSFNFENRNVVFEVEYFVNLNLKLICGFSTNGFEPIIWLRNKKKHFIGLHRDMWVHLMTYKSYIQVRLDQYDFFLDSFNLLDDHSNENIQFDFCVKRGTCFLNLRQNKNKIKIDSETWRSICRIGIFMTTFVCWNNILRKQISHFYFNYYIPTCALLKKTYIQVWDIKGFYEREVEVDLTRLCYEFGKKMPNIIKEDIKIYKLLSRMENK